MSDVNDYLLALSTDAVEETQPELYTSAVHALASYLRICYALTTIPAVDYERIGSHVQSTPSQEPASFERISMKRNLEAVFEATASRVGAKRWRHWSLVRAHQQKYPDGMSQEYGRDVARFVDGVLEEELAKRDLLARIQSPRPHREPAEQKLAA